MKHFILAIIVSLFSLTVNSQDLSVYGKVNWITEQGSVLIDNDSLYIDFVDTAFEIDGWHRNDNYETHLSTETYFSNSGGSFKIIRYKGIIIATYIKFRVYDFTSYDSKLVE